MFYSKNYLITILFYNLLLFGQSLELNPAVLKELENGNVPIEILQSGSLDILDEIKSEESIEDLNKSKLEKNNLSDINKVIESNKTVDVIDNNTLPNENDDDYDKLNENDNISKNVTDSNLSKSSNDINFFGYNVFSGDPELFQQSVNESIDQDYLVGPGDEIIVMLWGETEFNDTYLISKDGYLFIENIGQVFVNGLTLDKLEQKLFKLLKKVYSSLDDSNGNATTFFDVSLGKLVLRPLRIFVLGEVNQPGAYSVKPSTSIFTSLYYFNGPKKEGSLRNVKLVRNDKEIATIDFYDYLLSGKKLGDKRLLRDDVVFIPNRGKTVKILGEVKRQAIYELKPKEGLLEIIEMAGGLKSSAYSKLIQIDRILPSDERKITGLNKVILDINLEDVISSKKKFDLYNGDVIKISSISGAVGNSVSINGAVNRPGIYELVPGLKLVDLINKADGLSGDVYLKRVDIIRTNSDMTRSRLDVNLDLAMNGDINENLILSPNDEVNIYKNSEMLYRDDVQILGHVKNPGRKLYMSGMQIFDLVFLGGGFDDEIFLKNTYLDRAQLERLDDDGKTRNFIPFRLDSVLAGKGIANMDVEMGDIVRIYSKEEVKGIIPNVVGISGHVKKQGTFGYFNDMRFNDLLFMAGGFEDSNHINKLFEDVTTILRYDPENPYKKKLITYDLARIIDNSNNFNPLIFPGDEISIFSKDMFKKEKNVIIDGFIPKPGEYKLTKNMTLRDLLLMAGGVENTAKKFIVDLARTNDNFSTDKKKVRWANIYSWTFENISDNYKHSGNKNLNFSLEDNDFVIVRKFDNFKTHNIVNVSGAVNFPGNYILTSSNDLVTDLINRAGGLLSNAYPLASKLIRDNKIINLSFKEIIRFPSSKKNFTLIDGDSLVIGVKTNMVRIEGEVNSPGNYQYFDGKRFNDYIDLAGGFTRDASKSASYVSYPNGKSKKIKLIGLSPEIFDGSIIYVGKKQEVEVFSFTEFVTTYTSIWADITQAWLMINLATR